MALRSAAVLAIGAILLVATPLRAQDKLVVDIWGGNFRDGANEAIAKSLKEGKGSISAGALMNVLPKPKAPEPKK